MPANINSDNDIGSDSDREREAARPSIIYDLPDNAILSNKERQEKYRSAGDQCSSQLMITTRKYRRRNPKKIIPMDSSDIAKEEKSKLLLDFEEAKIYKYYSPKFNQTVIL